MNEFFWSVIGSAVVGGVIVIGADAYFDKHWNFWLVSAIVFVVYWLIRFGAGDNALDIGNPFD